jgi:hypothetical protein
MTDTLSSSEGRINVMPVYARPGANGSVMAVQSRHDNYLGGKWVGPRSGQIPRERTQPFPARGTTPPPERAPILNKIADRIAWRRLAHQERTCAQNKSTHGVDYESVDCLEKR